MAKPALATRADGVECFEAATIDDALTLCYTFDDTYRESGTTITFEYSSGLLAPYAVEFFVQYKDFAGNLVHSKKTTLQFNPQLDVWYQAKIELAKLDINLSDARIIRLYVRQLKEPTAHTILSHQLRVANLVIQDQNREDIDSSLTGGNMVVNPSFELHDGNKPEGWFYSIVGDSIGSIVEDANSGNYAVKLEKKAGLVIAVSQLVDVKPNTEYTLSCFAKADVVGGNANIFGYRYDRSGQYIGAVAGKSVPNGSKEYEPLIFTFRTGKDDRRFAIRFEIYGDEKSGVAYVDDVYFGLKKTFHKEERISQKSTTKATVEQVEPVQQISQVNLLTNPSFEDAVDGFPAYWFAHKASDNDRIEIDRNDQHGGKQSIKLTKNEGSRYLAIAQNVEVEPNTEYNFSGFGKASVRNGTAYLFGYRYDETGEWLGNIVPAYVPNNTEQFQPLMISFKTGPKDRKVQIRFEIYGETISGVAWLDDVYFGRGKVFHIEEGALAEKGTVKELKIVEPTFGGITDKTVIAIKGNAPVGSTIKVKVNGKFLSDILLPGTTLGEIQVRDDGGFEIAPVALNVGNNNIEIKAHLPNGETLKQSGSLACKPLNVATEYSVWPIGSTTKIKRNQVPAPSNLKKDFFFETAKNEYESFQIVVTAHEKSLANVKLEYTDFASKEGHRIPKDQMEAFLVHYLFVDRPSNPDMRPDFWPDALPPLRPFHVGAYENQPIWIVVRTKEDTIAGDYEARFTIKPENADPQIITVTLRVRDFALPVTPSVMSFTSLSSYYISLFHQPMNKKIHEDYYWYLVEHRLMPGEIPYALESPEAERFVNDPRVSSINVAGLFMKGDVLRPKSELQAAQDFLAKKGWLDKSYLYIWQIDEPTPQMFPKVQEICSSLDNAGINIPHVVTIDPKPDLINYIKAWVPNIGQYNPERILERQEAGDVTWWYTACGPKQPYPTFLIDDWAIAPRILEWQQWRYDITGLLYWCPNYWKDVEDPWINPMTFPAFVANGDGSLLYPGSKVGLDGPVGSIRLEMIREGLEDYEYLKLFSESKSAWEKEVPQEAADFDEKDLIADLAPSLTDFTKDQELLLRARSKIATGIEYYQLLLKNREALEPLNIKVKAERDQIVPNEIAKISLELANVDQLIESIKILEICSSEDLAVTVAKEFDSNLNKNSKTKAELQVKAQDKAKYGSQIFEVIVQYSFEGKPTDVTIPVFIEIVEPVRSSTALSSSSIEQGRTIKLNMSLIQNSVNPIEGKVSILGLPAEWIVLPDSTQRYKLENYNEEVILTWDILVPLNASLGNYEIKSWVDCNGKNLTEHQNSIQVLLSPEQSEEYVEIKRVQKKVKIDGDLNKKVWKEAIPLTGFVRFDKPELVSEQTVAKFAYDDDALHFSIICYESSPNLLKANAKKDGDSVWLDDSIELFIDTNHDHQTYFHLVVNSIGTLFSEVNLGQSHWEVSPQIITRVEKDKWIVEGAIPFTDLGFVNAPDVDTIWGLNVCRNQTVKREASVWSCTYGGFHSPGKFGHMKFK
jgi:hypothetical protein